MREELRQAWGELEGVSGIESSLRARLLDGLSISGQSAFVAIDSRGERHLLLPTESDANVGLDARSAGIQIASRELVNEGRTERYVDVHCLKPHLNPLFDVVAEEMIASAELVALDRVVPECRAVLERWRELIDRAGGTRIDMQVLVGAWGELWFVREALREGVPFEGLWIGPLGELHDLRGLSGAEVEVKTTLARGPLLVEIHGLDQLELEGDRPLYLGVLRLARVPEGENLADLIDGARDAGASSGELDRLLAGIGLAASMPEVAECCFEVKEARLYKVTSGFPRIVRSSLTEGRLPAGTASLVYTLDLTGEPPAPLLASEFARTLGSLGKA